MIPADIGAQYKRNFRRDSASVVITRVRVTKNDSRSPTGSAASVQTIFTNPGSSNEANSSGGRGWNVTS